VRGTLIVFDNCTTSKFVSEKGREYSNSNDWRKRKMQSRVKYVSWEDSITDEMLQNLSYYRISILLGVVYLEWNVHYK
jgi:hypothetical protein